MWDMSIQNATKACGTLSRGWLLFLWDRSNNGPRRFYRVQMLPTIVNWRPCYHRTGIRVFAIHWCKSSFAGQPALQGRRASAAIIHVVVRRGVAAQTVLIHLLGSGLHARRPVTCLPFTAAHCQMRLLLYRARAHWRAEWTSVLFTDESTSPSRTRAFGDLVNICW